MVYCSMGGGMSSVFCKIFKKNCIFFKGIFRKKIRENLDFRATFTSRQILKNIAQIQKATSRARKKG